MRSAETVPIVDLPTFSCGMLYGVGLASSARWWWAVVLLAVTLQSWLFIIRRRAALASAEGMP